LDFEIPDRWAILRLAPDAVHGLRLRVRDDRGRRRTGWPLPAGGRAQPVVRGPLLEFALPAEMLAVVAAAAAGLPERRSAEHGGGAVSLPLFLELAPQLRHWVERVRLDLLGLEKKRVHAVDLAPRRWLRRSPFRLPLHVLAVNTGEWRRLRDTDWYRREAIREHGLVLAEAAPEGLEAALRAAPRDVLLVTTADLPRALGLAGRLSGHGARPRLVVALAEPGGPEPYREALTWLAPGTSLLWVEPSRRAQATTFVEEFLEQVIHDFPLHEARRAAIEELGGGWAGATRLAADPRSNQDLRLSAVAVGIEDESVHLGTATPGDFDEFLRRTGIEPSPEVSRALGQAKGLEERVRRQIAFTRGLGDVEAVRTVRGTRGFGAGFGHEGSGLVPLAEAQRSLAAARHLKGEVRKALRPVARSLAFAEEVRRHQTRRVDAALQSLDGVPVRAVPTTHTLRRGGRYRLRVHVGHRTEESLMTGEPPPLDPLLPAPKRKQGHTLHVVVYEKDFTALSPRLRALHLPDLGGSRPVSFELRAPERDGPARLRLKVYHGNQLLQSFVLTAHVAAREERAAGPQPALAVDLVYSRSARFANLGDFPPRALSVGVNQESDGSHLFMFKVGKAVEAIGVAEEVLSREIGSFRAVLQNATFDEHGEPRFATWPAPGTPPSAEFHQVIRDLADAGARLHDALWVRMSKGLKDRLRAVAKSADHTIQLVRDDPKYVFPWAALYDFGLPERRAGETPPPVCLGFDGDPGEPPHGAPAKRCAHGPGDAVYCVWGFWGIRHALEVLLARGGVPEDEVTVVERAGRDAAVCLAVGADDEFAVEFVEQMKGDLKSAVRVAAEGDDLVDLLWRAAERPALLVVLGHLETAAAAGEPAEPRIVLVPKKSWFRAGPVTAREKADGEWEQPRTVVLVMACGSAATEVGTLNDFVTALSSAGAAAVVGTECPAFTRLLARFAREVIADLWSGKTTLGEAIKGCRRRLVAAGNPLAFVFSAAGNADLVLDLKGG
jgi:hypothetical protein